MQKNNKETHQLFNTTTPLSITLTLLLLTIVVLIGFYLGIWYSDRSTSDNSFDQRSYETVYLQSTKNLQACLSREACYEKRGEYISSQTTKYSPEYFRLDSSVLIGKDVEVVTYSYCGGTITSKQIEINNIWITVWEPGLTIFGGYENHGIKSREKKEIGTPNSVPYISQNGIEMLLTDSHEKNFESVMFTFHKPVEEPSYKSPGSYYVEIGHQLLSGRSYTSPESDRAFQELKEFVDTLVPVPFKNWAAE